MDQAGLLKMLDVPHFGRGTQVTVVVKQLLMLVHDGHLWIGDKKIPINGELIQRITSLPIAGPNPATEFPSKHEDMKLAQAMKERFGLTKGKRGYHTSVIREPHIRFAAKLLAYKVMWKCRPTEVPALVIRIAMNCIEGYSYNWVDYIVKEFLEDAQNAQEKGRPFHYSRLLVLIALVGWREPIETQFPDAPKNTSGAARYASLWVSQDKKH